jgi:hypothetical protein
MQQYIGVKLINAVPMNRLEYNNLRGWSVPEDENPTDDGYLVEYVDGGKANVEGYAGYVSWSPKQVFERAYRSITCMTFGLAIEALKQGFKVARSGWNGKGMWLAYSPGASALPAEKFWAGPNRDYAVGCPGAVANVLPCITMKTATGEILMGWLASQTDMLAEDWIVVA